MIFSTRIPGAEFVLFAAVGLIATLVHFCVGIFLIEKLHWAVWLANIVGFLTAWPVSYLGHSYLTFSKVKYNRQTAVTRTSATRFLVLSLSAFTANQASVVFWVELFGFPHRETMVLTLISVALLTFIAGKIWAFNGK